MMDKRLISFYADMMKKLNTSTGEYDSIREFLHDICEFFDFGCGFVYQANYSSIFTKYKCHQSYDFETLQDTIDLRDVLGNDLYSELKDSRIVMFSKNKDSSELELKLASIFNAGSFVMVPVKNEKKELAGIIGLADRRGENRRKIVELEECLYVLSLLVNSVKLEICQAGLLQAEQALRNVLDHVGIDIYVNDYYTHDMLYANKSMAAPYGGVENMMGKKCWEAIFTDKLGECEFCPQKKLVDQNGQPTKIYSWDYQRAFDGSWFRVLSSAFPWIDGRLAHLIASVDITDSKENELLVQKIANHDTLTGLANRRKLLEDLEVCVAGKSDLGSSWYMLFCDLDGFKRINDNLGHIAGDTLLKELGKRLIRNPYLLNMSYRHGGDEFVILLPDTGESQQLVKAIESLFADFTTPCEHDNVLLECGCSIGVVHFPTDATNATDLLHFADGAMYEAKNAGKGTVRFYNNGVFADIETYIK